MPALRRARASGFRIAETDGVTNGGEARQRAYYAHACRRRKRGMRFRSPGARPDCVHRTVQPDAVDCLSFLFFSSFFCCFFFCFSPLSLSFLPLSPTSHLLSRRMSSPRRRRLLLPYRVLGGEKTRHRRSEATLDTIVSFGLVWRSFDVWNGVMAATATVRIGSAASSWKHAPVFDRKAQEARGK